MFKNGIDHVLENPRQWLGDDRFALITNPSGTTCTLETTVDALAATGNLTLLLGPEHGIRGNFQAGDTVENSVDERIGVPVVSLYGAQQHIPDAYFETIDAIVYDIQDVGARFYTYLSTLTYAMQDATKHNTRVIVLDRPNPLGLNTLEGICLEDAQSSFVGLYPIPTRYGLTIGEYARFINDTQNIHCDMTIVPCQPHSRSMTFRQTGLPWIAPSPNIPTPETALAYIGTCLLEGTNVSEGRGTTQPFELAGAPFIDAETLAKHLNKLELNGIRWREVHFTPAASKFANQLCHGVQLHVIDAVQARPFDAGLCLIDALRSLYPDDFQFVPNHFDNLLGTSAFRLGDESVRDLLERAKSESAQFKLLTRPYWLYNE